MTVFATLKNTIKGTFDSLTGVVDKIKKVKDDIDNARKDRNLISELDTQLEESSNRKSAYEKIWFTNIAFILGQHWLKWNDVTRKFEEPRMPDWRVKLAINKILPRYRKALNWLSTFNPMAVVTPNSNETLDIEAAQLGTKVLRGLKDKVHLAVRNHQMNQWRLSCGSAFIHYFWNSELGSEIPPQNERINSDNEELSSDTSAFKGEDKEDLPSEGGMFTGDVDIEVWNSFEVYPLGDSSSLDECPGLMHARYISVDKLKSRYPDKADEILPEPDETTAGMYLRKIEGLIGARQVGMPSDAEPTKKVLFKRVWERPSLEHPKGRFIAYAGNVLLEKLDSVPNMDLGKEFEMPVLKYDDLGVPGRFWGQATVEQQIPINQEYNRSISQIIEVRNVASKPKYVAPKGAVSKNSITSEPGEVIEVNTQVPGFFEPHPVTPPPLPGYVVALPQILESGLADVGAMHEPTRGEAPPGVKSGIGIRELKKSDEDEMNPLFAQDTENKKILFSALLKLVHTKYTEGRLIKVVGNDRTTEVINFIGADLENNTDVWVETTDIVSSTREGRQTLVLDFYDKGLLGDQNNDETRKRAIRLLEFGNIDDIWEEGSLDAKQARYENKELAKGNMQEVKWYDVHSAHMLEHLKLVKSPMFKKQLPEIQMATENHIKGHDDFMSGMHPENPQANLSAPPPPTIQGAMPVGG